MSGMKKKESNNRSMFGSFWSRQSSQTSQQLPQEEGLGGGSRRSMSSPRNASEIDDPERGEGQASPGSEEGPGFFAGASGPGSPTARSGKSAASAVSGTKTSDSKSSKKGDSKKKKKKGLIHHYTSAYGAAKTSPFEDWSRYAI
jgi:hypothetical protein